MGELTDRRAQTANRITDLQKLTAHAEAISASKACVYATGSFGRREASLHSDLDLFIVGKGDGKPGQDGKQGSLLKRLDEIRLKADLIDATRELHIPDFSGDGQYLAHYSVDELTKSLGKPEDDVENTFTARLLLLLESYPLVEKGVYEDIIQEVIAAYWRDYADHKTAFVPAFLSNDILRLWRTFCVNYEAGTERIPEDKKAKGKLKNYKLKHSRMLTCYSALLYLAAVYRNQNTVHPDDAINMSQLTPTERLEWLHDQTFLADSRDIIIKLLDQYEKFLETTNADEAELIKRFMDKETSSKYMSASYDFGDLVFGALNSIGNGNRFHRLLDHMSA